MNYLHLTLLSLFLYSAGTKAQTETLRYLESGFETLSDQQRWISQPADNDKKWTFQKGGIDSYNPDTAYRGEINAFYFWGESNAYIRKLVSPPIDLSDSKKPELSFAQAMLKDIWGNHNLKLLFKAGPLASWDTIATFTSSVQWTLRTFNIKDYGTKYLCAGFQVAFMGTSGGGHGICIDNVIIEEKDIIIRYPKSVKLKSVSQDPIPSGAIDIPLERVDIVVVGNTDPLLLDSIGFKSLSSQDSLFAINGFELVVTHDSIYRPILKGVSLKIGTPVNISNGKIIFNHLNHNLMTGYNAVWLVADIRSTAPHKSIADFKLEARSIKIKNTKYPSTQISPAGFNTIEHSVFYDSFDGINTWTVENDFEIATPKGYTAHITSDPDFAYSGNKSMGTDLITDGKYRLNITQANAYYATTPTINLKYFDNVKLSFKKWIAFEGNDQGVIEVSTDNGVTWKKIWDSKSDAHTPDNDWVNFSISTAFDVIAARHETVKVRFGVVYSDNSFAYSGFNIDNFAITGTYLTNDVGIVSLLNPVSDCFNPGKDSVRMVVRNYADRETASSIPVFFSVIGSESQRVYDTLIGPIPKDGAMTFRFTRPANFPSAGDYNNFKVGIESPGDQDPDNNIVISKIFIQKSLTPPHFENFETSGGYWKISGSNPTWLCKTPDGSIPSIPGSPNAWILSPFGNYLTDDTSYVESGCYNLSTSGRSVFEMNLWLDSEPGKDGALIEYSKDNGVNWNSLPMNEFGWNWNWYTGAVTTLSSQGWSGLNSQNWRTVRQVLPISITAEPKVKFRVKWASDADNTYRGMALDNVRLYTAPTDIGVSKIDSFANRCQYINPDQVTITIKNYGLNPVKKSDPVIVGFSFNQTQVDIDTFLLSNDLLPGMTVKHTFSKKIDIDDPANYNIKAYTLIETDPYFYLGNNDTLSLDFTVKPNPLTQLLDTIPTREPDTVIIRPFFNAEYDYLWNDMTTNSTYHVEHEGWYKVKVTATRGNGCIAQDSSYVQLLFNDAGVDSLIYPYNHCGLGKEELLQVRIRNFGTDSIPNGQKIAMTFELNGGAAISDTFVLAHTFYAGTTENFVFSHGSVDLSSMGTYQFRIYSSFSADTVRSNDSIIKSVIIYGHPSVSLGPDITVQAVSYTLDAGGGYTSYQWDNGATSQTRLITEAGKYWVRITDENQCDNYDTTYIWLKIRDIRPDGFSSPVSDCRFTSGESVSLRILNSGTDTVPAGQTIDVQYQMNAGSPVKESFNLSAPLLPGNSVIHTFSGEIDLMDTADYNFDAVAAITDDIRTTNDTSELIIYRYPKPIVDFGLADIVTIQDIQLEIEAGYSPYYSYKWQDNFNEHLYAATRSGNYNVMATDTRTSCFDGDSVTLFLIYNDITVTSTSLPAEGCTGNFEHVSVRIRNMGTSNIGMNVPIYVACDVNGARVSLDTLVRTSNFVTNSNIDLVLSSPLTINETGICNVSFYTLYADDMKSWNDTLVSPFNLRPSPFIDFGDQNGVLNVDLPHLLDAGTGNKAYEWQDGSTVQIFTVTEKGTYTVTVTGQNDCRSSKTVEINLSTGTEDNLANRDDVSVYPNPGNGLFYVKVNAAGRDDLVLRLINMQGQTVYIRQFKAISAVPERFDVQNLSRGMYHIVIQGGDLMYQDKLIIQ